MSLRLYLWLACTGVCWAKSKYPPPKIKACTNYFGNDTDDKNKVITVVDPDVPSMFCDMAKHDAPCTFIHKSGPDSKCAPPTPPDKCHRYLKVTYSSCDYLPTKLVGTMVGHGDVFTPGGVFKECCDQVEKTEMVCWGPKQGEAVEKPSFPESYDVEKCDCDGIASGLIFCPSGWNQVTKHCDGLQKKYELASDITSKLGADSLPSPMLLAGIGFVVAGSVVLLVTRRRQSISLTSNAGDVEESSSNADASLE